MRSTVHHERAEAAETASVIASRMRRTMLKRAAADFSRKCLRWQTLVGLAVACVMTMFFRYETAMDGGSHHDSVTQYRLPMSTRWHNLLMGQRHHDEYGVHLAHDTRAKRAAGWGRSQGAEDVVFEIDDKEEEIDFDYAKEIERARRIMQGGSGDEEGDEAGEGSPAPENGTMELMNGSVALSSRAMDASNSTEPVHPADIDHDHPDVVVELSSEFKSVDDRLAGQTVLDGEEVEVEEHEEPDEEDLDFWLGRQRPPPANGTRVVGFFAHKHCDAECQAMRVCAKLHKKQYPPMKLFPIFLANYSFDPMNSFLHRQIASDHLPDAYKQLRFTMPKSGPAVFDRHKWGRCAVVGNSGSLLHTNYGAEIDDHDVVFRINQAPTAGFKDKVGTKTTFRLLNHLWTVKYAARPHNSHLPLEKDVTLVTSRCGHDTVPATTALWRKHHQRHTVLVLHHGLVHISQAVLTEFRTCMGLSHRKYRGGRSPTSGLVAIIMLLSKCSHVTTYGFGVDGKQKTRYQYYRGMGGRSQGNPVHCFGCENAFIRSLAGSGMVTHCGTTGCHGKGLGSFVPPPPNRLGVTSRLAGTTVAGPNATTTAAVASGVSANGTSWLQGSEAGSASFNGTSAMPGNITVQEPLLTILVDNGTRMQPAARTSSLLAAIRAQRLMNIVTVQPDDNFVEGEKELEWHEDR